MKLRASLALLLGFWSILAAACVAGASSPVGPTNPLARFQQCPQQPGIGSNKWLCGTLKVPLDRANPSAGNITLAIYVLPHSDHSSAASDPLFTTPGGPGYAHFENYGLWPMQTVLLPHHDIVTIDERGTGASSAIDCPDLQHGAAVGPQLEAAVAACANILGSAADRYGAGDVALDMEAVRKLLGYRKIDYYGGSYGSVDAQAYAARFPQHVSALVLDSGFTVTAGSPDFANFFEVGAPAKLIEIAALRCRRDTTCSGQDRNPTSTLIALIQRVRAAPISAPASTPLPIDEAAVAGLVAGADPIALITAADALRGGDPAQLAQLVNAPPSDNGSIKDFSAGMNIAGSCNDSDSPWDRSDPVPTRKARLAAAIAALPTDAFAPFTNAAWITAIPYEACTVWPAPHRFEPVIPPGSVMPDVPVLILSGDVDGQVPMFVTRALLDEFPKATFVIVAGAGHQTLAGPGTCAASIAANFLDKLTLGDTSCAAIPS